MPTKDDLTQKQKDYAVFLPALSSFYSRDVSKQQLDFNYIDPARVPQDFENGVEGLNWMNKNEGYFTYHWSLYSAGHADLNLNKIGGRDDMVRNRNRKNAFVLGDSGGFQIGKGVWEGNWKDPNCPQAAKKRKQVLEWMDAYMDRGMILDIPAWVARSPAGQQATGITTYAEAVAGTSINNEYFMQNRNGNCKFLNVLQGETHAEADDWYEQMKHYCDPKQHAQPFEGWAMGGQNMCDVHLALRRIVALRFDGLLEPGLHDWMHFLGTSKLEWATLLTDIQRAVRKYHNENFTISFDCASPFLASANGQIYYDVTIEDRSKWSYLMQPSIDDKKYAKDFRPLRDTILQDGIFESFLESPISERLKAKDVCIYAPGDLNKLGKEGRTSWDSFSYTLQMGHNVWTHLYAVQEANRQYDAGLYPEMLVATTSNKKAFRTYDRNFFRDIVDDIFATSDRSRAEELIEHYNRYWLSIIGTRGAVGKKTVNSKTQFFNLFETEEVEEHHRDDSDLDESKLEALEQE